MTAMVVEPRQARTGLGPAAIDDMIASLLRGQDCPWPAESLENDEQDFLARADFHGVAALLNERFAALAHWPPRIRDGLRQRAIQRAAWELRHQVLLGEVLAALAAAGIEAVLFKGTALAYGVYDNPVWRVRGDTDMIVAPDLARRAGEILCSCGFLPDASAGGEIVSYQRSFLRSAGDGGVHAIDLHHRINNSELLSRLFDFRELRAAGMRLPALSPHAVAAGIPHALLLAALHPATHRFNPIYFDGVAQTGAGRLIWYYDIHLLATQFSDDDWRKLVRDAAGKGLCATTLEGLQEAARLFGTKFPAFVAEGLSASGEPVAAYLRAGRMRQAWIDFMAIQDYSARARFLRELLFPDREYMLARYADSSKRALPWLYIRRALQGIAKRLPND